MLAHSWFLPSWFPLFVILFLKFLFVILLRSRKFLGALHMISLAARSAQHVLLYIILYVLSTRALHLGAL